MASLCPPAQRAQRRPLSHFPLSRPLVTFSLPSPVHILFFFSFFPSFLPSLSCRPAAPPLSPSSSAHCSATAPPPSAGTRIVMSIACPSRRMRVQSSCSLQKVSRADGTGGGSSQRAARQHCSTYNNKKLEHHHHGTVKSTFPHFFHTFFCCCLVRLLCACMCSASLALTALGICSCLRRCHRIVPVRAASAGLVWSRPVAHRFADAAGPARVQPTMFFPTPSSARSMTPCSKPVTSSTILASTPRS